MKLSDFALPSIELSSDQRSTLEKYLPLVIVAILAWFAARCLKRMFWVAFGLFWAFVGWHGMMRHLFW
jgi:hypothetical protein